MINIFEYTYYRIYDWSLNKWGAKDVPEYKSMFVTAIIMFQNICMIGLLLNAFGIVNFSSISKNVTIAAGIAFFVLCYFLFVHNGRFELIVSKFKSESKTERKSHTLWMWLYILISFGINILLIAL